MRRSLPIYLRNTPEAKRRIDLWVLDKGWVREQTEGDRCYAVFAIRMLRVGRILATGDESKSRSLKFSFDATLIREESSKHFAKADLSEAAGDLTELRNKVVEAFEGYTAQDWTKIILVAIETPESYKCPAEATEIKFNYAVVEKAGSIYRQGSRKSRVTEHFVEGDVVHELPYDEALEAKLRTIRSRLSDLAEVLKGIVASPEKLKALTLRPLLTR